MSQIQTTTVNVRVNEAVKRNVEALFDSMGMNISTAVNMFFRQCLAEEALPFQPKAKSTLSLNSALTAAQEQAGVSDTSEMSLADINDIITEVRQEKRSIQ